MDFSQASVQTTTSKAEVSKERKKFNEQMKALGWVSTEIGRYTLWECTWMDYVVIRCYNTKFTLHIWGNLDHWQIKDVPLASIDYSKIKSFTQFILKNK